MKGRLHFIASILKLTFALTSVYFPHVVVSGKRKFRFFLRVDERLPSTMRLYIVSLTHGVGESRYGPVHVRGCFKGTVTRGVCGGG